MTVRVLAFVEGQTDEKFGREVVSPSLATRNVFISATTPGRRRAHGGVPSWARAKRELLRYLKEDTERFVTTMFDYYGLPSDWPGKKESKRETRPSTKAEIIEQAVHADVCATLGESFDGARFLPYIQMHEFEALLFSDTRVLAESVQRSQIQTRLDEIIKECGEPERIDDDPETAPSKRICALVPRYQKVLHGIIAAKRIGLATMRDQCPHFAQWIEVLEQLGDHQD
ncbi:MAG: DUF4276 family protein [Planctomycetes bacterium]|nr:DUF4276 family protein [Planctomycetota bacterium]